MFTMSCFITSNFFSGVVINVVFTTNISLIIFLFWKRIFSLLFNEDFHTRHLKYFLYFSVLLLKYFVSGVEIFQSYCWIGRHLYPDPKAASSYCGCFSFPHQRKEIIEAVPYLFGFTVTFIYWGGNSSSCTFVTVQRIFQS